MSNSLAWWLVIEGVGLVALPIALIVFRRLPDAGYAFTKPLGLLLGAYLFWLALSLHILPNRPGSIVWVFVVIVLVDAWLVARSWREMLATLQSRAGVILAVEVLFTLGFALAVYLKAFVPDIAGTEKPMDYMLLNTAARSRFYPPADPWFAGADVSYYYFGYVIQAMVAKLSAVPTPVAFNLALASTAALAATAAFGLAYDLVALARGTAFRVALAGGLLAALFVTVLGNLEGLFEFLIANGADGQSLAQRLDIANLDQAQSSAACLVNLVGQCLAYPNEQSSFWWWWRATRISPTADSITEFPFFSFLLGDLHPHVMAIPYALTAAALGLAFWRSETPPSLDTWRRAPAMLLLAGVVVGALGFLNTWDLPTFGFVIAALVVARNLIGRTRTRSEPAWLWALVDSAGFLLPLFFVALLAYAPFYAGFESQASGLKAVTGAATLPQHSLLFWGPLLLVALPMPLIVLSRDPAGWVRLRVALLLPAGLLTLWALLALATDGSSVLGDALTDRGSAWLTLLFFASALATAVAALWSVISASKTDEVRADEAVAGGQGGIDAGLVPALVLIATALILIYGSELFYIHDVFGTRLNTVFKLSYQAWLTLGVGAAFSACWLVVHWRPAVASRAYRLRRVWAGAAVAVVLAALLYPLGATLSRTQGLSANRTLDGLAYIKRGAPEDLATASWLRTRAGPGERIVEATGGQYTLAGRLAVLSGVPAVVGWGGHEVQWGRDPAEINQRVADVDRAYTTESLEEAVSILQKYNVTYIAVGGQERAKYAAAGLQKFESALPSAFRSGQTTLYRIPAPQLNPGEALQ